MEQPIPPEGYKLVKGQDIKDTLKELADIGAVAANLDRVPEGAKFWEPGDKDFDWFQTSIPECSVPSNCLDLFYAIPSSPDSITDTDTAKAIVAGDPYQVHIGGVRADPYRIARAYGINDPVIFQALKKLLRCGRKHKDQATDVREAITSLERWEAMNEEDSK